MIFRRYLNERQVATGCPDILGIDTWARKDRTKALWVDWFSQYWTQLLYFCAALLVLVLFFIGLATDIPFGVFTQDPMALTKGSPYFGLLSNIGILFSPLIMAVALTLFGLSLAEDVLALAPERWHYLLEDGAKFFGIISWFNYFVLVCREEVKRCVIGSPR